MSTRRNRSGRSVMLWIGGGVWALTALVGALMWLDLHDGVTWNERGRVRERGESRFYWIHADANPGGFKAVWALRYVMPMVLLGTCGAVFTLGALAMPTGRET